MNTVRIRYSDPARIRDAVERYARRIKREHPEITRVCWFGSWVNGTYSPGSDVDLCIVVSEADKPPRDRIADFLPKGFPVGLDIFVYTEDELERLKTSHPSWHAAIHSGIEL